MWKPGLGPLWARSVPSLTLTRSSRQQLLDRELGTLALPAGSPERVVTIVVLGGKEIYFDCPKDGENVDYDNMIEHTWVCQEDVVILPPGLKSRGGFLPCKQCR